MLLSTRNPFRVSRAESNLISIICTLGDIDTQLILENHRPEFGNVLSMHKDPSTRQTEDSPSPSSNRYPSHGPAERRKEGGFQGACRIASVDNHSGQPRTGKLTCLSVEEILFADANLQNLSQSNIRPQKRKHAFFT